MKKPRCSKWITLHEDEGPISQRCRLDLGHKGHCCGTSISGAGYIPGDEPGTLPPFSQVVMTSPGIWSVEIWSVQGVGYLPAGEIVENYRPYEEWANSPIPTRDGFRYKLLTERWEEARVIHSFLEARDWILNHNPFGIVPF